jgi:adenylate kinase
MTSPIASTAPKLVILGRQGAGKGTQASRLANHYGLAHLSTGDVLRAEVKRDTELGTRVGRLLERGELVPDHLMVAVVKACLSDPEVVRRGFLLDGFPRTLAQAEELTTFTAIDAVIDLVIPAAVARQRLTSRRVCPTCGTITVDLTDGAEQVRCPRGDGWAVRRSDDAPEAIDRRLALYEAQAGPIEGYFARRGLLLKVEAAGSPDTVFERIARDLRPMLWGEGMAVG